MVITTTTMIAGATQMEQALERRPPPVHLPLQQLRVQRRPLPHLRPRHPHLLRLLLLHPLSLPVKQLQLHPLRHLPRLLNHPPPL